MPPRGQDSLRRVFYAGPAAKVAKGWNGNLAISAEGVTIRRGLKGLLTRKRLGPELKVPFADIDGVRLLPASRLVAYLQLVTAPEAMGQDYLSTIRDDHTVTFTKRRTPEFMEAAHEIAALTGVEVEPAGDKPDYWTTVMSAAPVPVRLNRVALPKPIGRRPGSEREPEGPDPLGGSSAVETGDPKTSIDVRAYRTGSGVGIDREAEFVSRMIIIIRTCFAWPVIPFFGCVTAVAVILIFVFGLFLTPDVSWPLQIAVVIVTLILFRIYVIHRVGQTVTLKNMIALAVRRR